MNYTNKRRSHGPTDRSVRTDSLAWLLKEIEGSGLDAERMAHLRTRVKRAMREHRTAAERDLAAAAERAYGISIDPAVVAAERRRALASWTSLQRELAVVARREQRASGVFRRGRGTPFRAAMPGRRGTGEGSVAPAGRGMNLQPLYPPDEDA